MDARHKWQRQQRQPEYGYTRFKMTAEDRAWLDLAPAGREFGSLDHVR
jgi:hypothetical protein